MELQFARNIIITYGIYSIGTVHCTWFNQELLALLEACSHTELRVNDPIKSELCLTQRWGRITQVKMLSLQSMSSVFVGGCKCFIQIWVDKQELVNKYKFINSYFKICNELVHQWFNALHTFSKIISLPHAVHYSTKHYSTIM